MSIGLQVFERSVIDFCHGCARVVHLLISVINHQGDGEENNEEEKKEGNQEVLKGRGGTTYSWYVWCEVRILKPLEKKRKSCDDTASSIGGGVMMSNGC